MTMDAAITAAITALVEKWRKESELPFDMALPPGTFRQAYARQACAQELADTLSALAAQERKPFKLDVSKEWCERMANLEEGHDISAGSLAALGGRPEPVTGKTGKSDHIRDAAEMVDPVGGRPETGWQPRVRAWVLECFGQVIADDMTERSFRFIEEALELVQSVGCSREQAHTLVDYVFDRPTGDSGQEVGGVMVTLAALTSAAGVDMHAAAERELARISTPETIAKIRRKQASKRGVVSHAAEAALPGEWSSPPLQEQP